jgi:hypothetical protein
MALPTWLQTKINLELSGAEIPGYALEPRAGRCVRCRRPILRGLDDITCGLPVRVDPDSVTPMGEAWALGQSRGTYRLAGMVVARLWRRDRWERVSMPIGSEDSTGVVRVVVEHRCGEPIPAHYREE